MKTFLSSFAVFLLFSTASLQGAMQAGDTFPGFTVQDQHEVAYSLEKGVRYVIVSFDMPSGKATNKYLEEQGADFLPENNAVFLSNIYGMPWVGRKFALPKMKKYPHRILIADDENLLTDYPQKKGQVTVLELDADFTIKGIKYWDPKSGKSPFGG